MKCFCNRDNSDNVEKFDDQANYQTVDKVVIKHIKELFIKNQRTDIPKNNINYIKDVQHQH